MLRESGRHCPAAGSSSLACVLRNIGVEVFVAIVVHVCVVSVYGGVCCLVYAKEGNSGEEGA